MKHTFRIGLISLGVLVASANTFAGDEQRFSGTWHNQFGSEMRIAVDPQGKISGKYHTSVGREEVTQPEAWFDVTGYVNGDEVSFVVSWGPASGAITAWSGHFVSRGGSSPEIRTLTHTTVKVTEKENWKRIVAGNDTFVPGPSPLLQNAKK
jgi:hypothetical protein